MKAIITKSECPSCGAVLKVESVLEHKAGKFSFPEPTKCNCGRKGKFKLLTFEPAQAVIVDDSMEIIAVPSGRYEELLRLVSAKLEEKENEN